MNQAGHYLKVFGMNLANAIVKMNAVVRGFAGVPERWKKVAMPARSILSRSREGCSSSGEIKSRSFPIHSNRASAWTMFPGSGLTRSTIVSVIRVPVLYAALNISSFASRLSM